MNRGVACLMALALATVACSERGKGQTGFGGAAPSGAGGSGVGGQGAGGAPSGTTAVTGGAFGFDIVDRGVVVRYYLDEASSGIDPPATVLDAAPDPLDLPLTGDLSGATYQYDEDSGGNRGLRWVIEDATGGPSIPIAGTKVFDRLHQASEGTIELVYDVEAVSQSTSRLMHIGYEQMSGWFTMGTSSVNRVTATVNAAVRLGEWDVPGAGRVVVHVVYDSNHADPDQRARFYANGAPQPNLGGDPITQGYLIDLQPGPPTVLTMDVGHRSFGERSIKGVVGYAAYYDVALTHHEVIQNTTVLLDSDDAP